MDFYTSIIVEEMESEGALPEDTLEETKRQGVRGFSDFSCSDCGRTWTSYRGHVVIDLSKQRVVKFWKQKCMICEQDEEPSFKEDEFRRMVIKAINQEFEYRIKFEEENNSYDDSSSDNSEDEYEDDDDDDDDDSGDYDDAYEDHGDDDTGHGGQPHLSALCEKCGYGARECWKK